MENLIFSLIVFIVVYLFYVLFVLNRKNVLKKFPDSKNMKYLKYKYGIKINDKNLKKIANTVFLANSFILAIAVYIACLFDDLIIGVLAAFVPLILMIIGVYHIIGICYKDKKNK